MHQTNHEITDNQLESFTHPEIVLLAHEEVIQDDRYDVRQKIADQLIAMPDEVLGRANIFQPSVGCLGRCSFCSQSAGTEVRWLEPETLEDIMSAMKTAMNVKGIVSLGAERPHKAGAIHAYLDNDVLSYPYLDKYVAMMGRDLGTRTRISSIGYSRHNPGLQTMHEVIAADLLEYVDGIRLTWTPFTYAWAVNSAARGATQQEYIADFANTISTYKPLLEQRGAGVDTFCIAMRFEPSVNLVPEHSFEHTTQGTIIKNGPYAVVPIEEPQNLNQQVTVQYGENGEFELSNLGSGGIILAGAEHIELSQHLDDLKALYDSGQLSDDYTATTINGQKVLARVGRIYSCANDDGPYFAIDPFSSTSALHLYQQTENRRSAGFIDSAQHVRQAIDIARTAVDAQPQSVVDLLEMRAAYLDEYLPQASRHIKQKIIPMIQGLVEVFKLTDLPNELFFDPNFLLCTDDILNQGRAHTKYYKNIVSKELVPLTPKEEAYNGDISRTAALGTSWTISFSSPEIPSTTAAEGKKNALALTSLGQLASGISIREWDHRTFDNISAEGKRLRAYFIKAPLYLGRASVSETVEKALMPGVIAHG